MSKRCTVACDTDQGVLTCELELPDDATVATALVAARAQLSAHRGCGRIDWEHAAVGIHGRLCSRDQVPDDGDRVEVYRALRADPRARRRARVARTRR